MNKIILSMGLALLMGNIALAADRRIDFSERRPNSKVETQKKEVEKLETKDCQKSEKNHDNCCDSAKVEDNKTQATKNSNC